MELCLSVVYSGEVKGDNTLRRFFSACSSLDRHRVWSHLSGGGSCRAQQRPTRFFNSLASKLSQNGHGVCAQIVQGETVVLLIHAKFPVPRDRGDRNL